MKDEESLFAAAVALAPQDRASYLDGACGGDADLRRRVEALLSAHDRAGGILDATANVPEATGDPAGGAPEPPVPVGSVIGPYKLLELIGEGGMGAVYMAEQQRPVRRAVALKVIKPGMDTKQAIARFEAERQALALMDHPNIARVLDAGSTDAGRLYFVMELVKGVPVTDYCDANRLTPRQRLELFVQVCHAVQHAHQKGIIHRDLKPSNVLVTLHDGKPVPKIIDFGIAKATQGRLTDLTLFTNFAQMMGTPLYMSPEQAELSGLDVDTRSDVYSLGVLLYELLTGTTPFDKTRFARAAYDEIRRIIREEEPPRPSTRISTLGETLTAVSGRRGTEPKRLGRLVRGELDWIVMKALEKDRTRRFETASAFAADVQRHLGGKAVEACPPSAAYRLRKLAGRHRVTLATAAGFVVVLVGATVVSVWLSFRAVAAERLAEQRARRANTEAEVSGAIEDFMNEGLLAQASAELGGHPDLKFRTVIDRAAAKVDRQFAGQPMVEVRLRVTLGRTYLSLGSPEQAEVHLRRASDLTRQFGEDEHGTATRVQLILASAMMYRERFDEAEGLARDALGGHRRAAGHDCMATLEAMRTIAAIHFRRGRYAEGEALIREAIDVSRRLPGAPDGLHLALVRDMTAALSYQDRPSEFEATARELADALKRLNGPEDRQALLGLVDLASACADNGRTAEAEEMLSGVLATQRRVLGEDDTDTLRTASYLGEVHMMQGRYEEAHAGLSAAVASLRRILDGDHEQTLDAEYRLAKSLTPLGRHTEAEAVLRRVLQARRRMFAVDAVPVIRTTHALASALTWQRKWQEAHDLAHEAYDRSRRKLGEDAPLTLEIAQTLGTALCQLDRPEEAVPLFTRVAAARRRANDPADEYVRTACAYLSSGGRVIFTPVLEQPVPEPKVLGRAAMFAQQFVDFAPENSHAWAMLGIVHYRTGRWKDAVGALERSLALVRHSNSGGLTSAMFMAMAHHQLNDPASARSWYTAGCIWQDDLIPQGQPESERPRAEAAQLLGFPKQWPVETWQPDESDRRVFDRVKALNSGFAPLLTVHRMNREWLQESKEGVAPFGPAPAAVPGTVQAEDFDRGGPGVAYFDSTVRCGGLMRPYYRGTSVDLDICNDEGGGCNVGGMSVGEWLNYTVQVAEAGAYDIDVRVASALSGGSFHLEFGGGASAAFEVPRTGDWQRWTTITCRGVLLQPGRQVMKLVVDSAPARDSGAICNVNWVRFRRASR